MKRPLTTKGSDFQDKSKDELIRELINLNQDYLRLQTSYEKTHQDLLEKSEAYQASEDKFLRTFMESPVASCINDLEDDFRFMEVNETFLKKTGYGRQEVIGKTTGDLKFYVDPEDRDAIQKLLLKNGRVDNYEFRYRKKNGDIAIGLLNDVIIRINGKTMSMMSAMDITQIRETERQFKESEEKYRLVAENISDVVWILNVTQGKFTYISPSIQKLRGLAPEEAMNQKLENLLLSKDFDAMSKRIEESIEHFKKSDEPRSYLDVIRQPRKNGDFVWVEISTRFQKNSYGEIEVFGVSRNVDERKAAETMLKESQLMLQSVVNSTSDLIWSIDATTSKILTFNDAFKIYALENLGTELKPGMTQKEILPTKELQEEWTALYRRVLSEGSFTTEYVSNVSSKVLLLTFNPLLRDTAIYGISVFAKDISQIKEAEKLLILAKEKAEESDRLKTAFLMNMSHEIRTPLNGMLGFIEVLKDSSLKEEQKIEYIGIVNKSGERLLATINDILEISQIEAGAVNVHKREVNFADIIQFHCDFFGKEIESKGLQLVLSQQVTGPSAVIWTDKYKVDSILSNLIKNAIKFTEKGSIEIGSYIRNNSLIFYVKDTGRGIPSDRFEAIFDRFVQADLSLTRAHEGSGLGLSIVKAHIEALNGKIWLESEIGKGSTFYVSLPIRRTNTDEESTIEMQRQIKKIPEDTTLLIVEDDEISYRYFDVILSPYVKLIHAKKGTEALEILKKNKNISLIFMDLKIPGEMDGFETTRRIRRSDKKIPIIAQTAFAMEKDNKKALQAGCNDFITKPIHKDKLLTIVVSYCN